MAATQLMFGGDQGGRQRAIGGRLRSLVPALCVDIVLVAASLALARQAPAQCETEQLSGGLGPWTSNLVGALDGNRAAVGDSGPYDDQDPATIGSIHIYEASGLDWTLEATILEPIVDPTEAGAFAKRMSMEAESLLAGSRRLPLQGLNSGAAFVFRKFDHGWALDATLMASDGSPGDLFGLSVDLDGDWAVIGARDDDIEHFSQAGSAYVFHYDQGSRNWVEVQKLTGFVPETFRLFGSSVAIDGDWIVVGAHGGGNPSYFSGSAYVFRFDGERWVEEVELVPFDGENDDRFGWSVSLKNDVIAVGAYQGGPVGGPQSGATYVYRHLDEQWTLEQKLLPLDYEGCCPAFGISVSLNESADALLVGATGDQAAGYEAGSVHIFHNTDGAWVGVPPIYSSTPETFGHFGQVQASSDRAVVGAFDGPGDAGLVHVIDGILDLDCNNNGQPDACDIFYGFSGDADGDRIPDECDTAADINNDGVVGAADLGELLAQWGPCPPPDRGECLADFAPPSGDLQVNVFDLAELLANWS